MNQVVPKTESLRGKSAIVTGGGRGIGRAVAVALAGEGVDVCVLSRTADELSEVERAIRERGVRGLARVCDMGDGDAVQGAVNEAAERFGRLDLLVNNAGLRGAVGPLETSDPEQWMQAMRVNLFGAYAASRAAIPHLRKVGGGKIINVGSGSGHQPQPGNSAYAVSKAAVSMLTRSLAVELWRDGIAVNEVIPGPVYTRFTEGLFDEGMASPPALPMERVKRPDDCVPLFLFLAGQPAGGPTGQTFSLARRPL